ncbi:LOW QUALITY PROTEIN: limbin-like [Cottoperca gobio]|uniref:LOW QUALITY PROTEIN: limbin-like n=1 Tax=Cottoperca gobio TaxID=56716 RepID=A0A6J2PP42_COTGO|nr:LOW QUALITY PROTEIN: limbin [Cottoperca gobio]
MLQVHFTAKRITTWAFILNIQVLCVCPPPSSRWCRDVTRRAGVLESGTGHYNGSVTSQDASWHTSLLPPPFSDKEESLCCIHVMQHDPGGKSAEQTLLRMDGTMEINGRMVLSAEAPLSSSAPAGPWGHSLYTPLTYMSNILHLRNRRSTLTRYNPSLTLPQIQSVAPPSAYGVKFHKCAQVKLDSDPPQLTFFLLIHNMGPVGGTNLSQVAIRDSISGIVPLKSEGRVVERGYQTFAIDSLSAGSQVVVNYTARIRSHKSEVLDLPAFLTFSNASQNDVSMFGPLTANLTLRVNSTDRIYPNHAVHSAGFVAGFFVTLVLLSLGFLAMNLIGLRTRLNLLQQRRNRRDSDPEYAACNMSETVKDEAAFEDKMVDTMVLEDPQNMYQALENLEMSTLLHATNNLEATRIQIYKDVMSSLLGDLRSRGQASAQAQQRLLSVLHGQMLGMEGRLKEERGARMAALAGRCNLETREEMEAEHRREAAEKAQAELLCQHADQRELLHCSVLLEKLHKLSQSQLQRILLVRHEEASGKVQRQIIEWRRVELHKIFSEELEEATRMGELEKSTAKSLQHDYFACQDQLDEVLDVVLANQRYVLAERHAQRKFLVHSLHSLNSLISDSFSSTSSNLDSWLTHIRRGSFVSAEQMDQLQEKAQTELVMVRQRLDEALSQERRAMRCGLIKKRRELISDMLRVHKQRQKDLSGLSKGLEGRIDVAQHLHCWRNLLTAHSLELAELINNLDEEAAADIRKVTMRVIQGAVTEVKAIQPSATQALLTLLPPGAQRSLLQVELEAVPGQAQGQGASALLQGQERLHQEGKAALRTLSCTREALRNAMERELQEQRELRAHCRAFFSCLCSSQLTLSEDDRLRMKLEFQKCLSVMDRCLVLPHAVSRTKLHTALAAWRKESEQQITNMQSKGKTSEGRQNTDTSDLLLFQKRLEDGIQLFEKEKETESGVMNKVMEEMRREREDDLRSQGDSLAMQMATIHYQKAERRTKVLETSRAMLTLHSLLIQQLRERKSLERQDMAQSIQNHCLGLEEAEQQLQNERTELQISRARVESNPTQREDSDEGEGESEEERLFQLQRDCRMTFILQGALYKSDQVITHLAERLQEMTGNNQSMEDLKEQMELRRLYANCDQDLEFASRLVKQSHVSAEVLLEALRLLLPTLPESELVSITDALCPKQHPGSPSAEQEHSGCAGGVNRLLPVKLREDEVHKNMPNMPSCTVQRERLQEKRQSLMEKLLPRSRLLVPRDVAPLLVEEKGKEDSITEAQRPIYKSTVTENTVTQPLNNTAKERLVDTVNETVRSTAEEHMMPASAGTALGVPAPGERLFVFRVPPESCGSVGAPKSKRKKNFLNLKKGSVAPTNLP